MDGSEWNREFFVRVSLSKNHEKYVWKKNDKTSSLGFNLNLNGWKENLLIKLP